MVVDRAKVGPAILAVLPKPAGERRAAVGLAPHQGEGDHRGGCQALGIKEVMGQFTTSFPHAPYRNINIGTAAAQDQRHAAEAGRDVQPEQDRRRADQGERLHRGQHHQRRQVRPGPRRRCLAVGHHHLQRGVLRRAEGRRAQGAQRLHQPLPDRPRGDRGLAVGGHEVPQRLRARGPGADDLQGVDAGQPGQHHGEDLGHQGLGHHRGPVGEVQPARQPGWSTTPSRTAGRRRRPPGSTSRSTGTSRRTA